MGTIQIKKVEKKVVTGKVGHECQKVTKVAAARATAADSSRECFSCFFLSEKESLKGLTALVVRLSGCLHTSRIPTHGVNALTRASLSKRGF